MRSFSGRPVPPEVLRSVLSAARRAPAAGNTDGWDAVVLEGPQLTSVFWEATTTAEWRSRSARWAGMSLAPVVICVFSRPVAYLERYDEPDKRGGGLGLSERGGDLEAALDAWPVPYWFVDAGFAVLLMLLAATEAGLGACILGNFRGEQRLREALGVPSDRRYVCALMVGEARSDDRPSASASRPRRAVEEVFHTGRW